MSTKESMKSFLICTGVFIILLLKDMHNVRAATLKCTENTAAVDLSEHKVDTGNTTDSIDVINNRRKEDKNSLNKLFQNIQCTLEKAKPWVAELQQEAKRLEEAAKLLGLGIINSFGQFVDKLVDDTQTNINVNSTNSEGYTNNSTDAIVNEEISQYLCPEGFIADHNGICESID